MLSRHYQDMQHQATSLEEIAKQTGLKFFIKFRNCSDIVVFFIKFRNCSDSVVFFLLNLGTVLTVWYFLLNLGTVLTVWYFLLNLDTSVKSGRFKLFLWDQSEMMQSCKCFQHVSKMPDLTYN
jgi:hypothetical protein